MPLDAIWNRARADITITAKRGHPDLFLWEHSTRVAESAQLIAKLPIVQSEQPDEVAIVAAALYHDAGWAVRWRDGEIDRTEILLGPTTDTNREQGASMLESSLTGLLPPESLRRASRAVRSMNRRPTDSVEGQVVVEADNLDEFGMLPLWLAIRRGMLDGKGVQAAIDIWRRKKEYQFWTARLNDSFRLQPVRDLAEERLRKFERLMEELQEQHLGRDVAVLETARPSGRVGQPKAK